MRHFFDSLFGLIKQHPVLFLLFVVVPIVLLLGGLVWKGIGLVFGLVRKVPGGDAIADTAEKVVDKAARATGSA